jgi:hypothetical protein
MEQQEVCIDQLGKGDQWRYHLYTWPNRIKEFCTLVDLPNGPEDIVLLDTQSRRKTRGDTDIRADDCTTQLHQLFCGYKIFSHTHFNGGGGAGTSAPATVTRKDENVMFTRVQLAF